jgi:hypothetical protein
MTDSIQKMQSNDLGDLCEALMSCFQEARRVLAHNCFSAGQAIELAKYLETIRMLLQVLNQALHSPVGAQIAVPSINELRENYFELEGIVKELRNDLSGSDFKG